MSTSVKVAMKRGGFMHLEVDGRVYKDGNVEINFIKWPGGGEVSSKNIADMSQVQDEFYRVLEQSSKEI